ncbi:hypothetical protein [Aquipseudomonas alcaligenes]|uniref:hypothetical protein n=1 Tax=Aquipseudomonas alcaligenes TaxID=43263 RepID=UPI000A9C2B6A|nr:hypothetical protein [Pseudomonas alcaligenes]
MKVLASPDFNAKVPALNTETISSLSAFISSAEQYEKNDFILKNVNSMSLLDGDIYSAKINSSRLYFTIGADEQGDYLLLLDIAALQTAPSVKSSAFFTTNNPKTNSSLNPKLNSAINPKLNSAINPKLNSAINPKLNSAINPKLNSAINPKLNSAINPKLNSAINPKLNSAINPKLNSSLNPRLNRSYGGPYLYDANLNQEAYSVRANNKIEILFNSGGDFYGFLVSANDRVKIEFDTGNTWTGYYVKANEKVWLRYSLNNEWLGLLV